MPSPKLPSRPTEVVAAALASIGGRQADLAKLLNCSQPTVSKYKSGQLDLPGSVLLKCLKLSNLLNPPVLTESELAARIMKELSGARNSTLRRTIGELLDALYDKRAAPADKK